MESATGDPILDEIVLCSLLGKGMNPAMSKLKENSEFKPALCHILTAAKGVW